MVAKIKNYVLDVRKEMKKVSWPSRQQLKESTIVVLSVTAIFAIFVYLMDFGIDKIVRLIF